MKSTFAFSALTILLFSTSLVAQTLQSPKPAFDPLPRDLEIQLALSALPAHLRENATVYVLNPAKGFEIARTGTNGFHAFVNRTGEDGMQGSWPLTRYRDDILYPVSFDAAGAKANMLTFFDIAEMQAKGTPATELKRIIQERYKTGYYKAPERAGVSYMLSPISRTYVDPERHDRVLTVNAPHIMYFAPNVSSADIGAVQVPPEEQKYYAENGRWRNVPMPFVIHHGPHAYMIHNLGLDQTAQITKEYSAMLARLCKIKTEWCLLSSEKQ